MEFIKVTQATRRAGRYLRKTPAVNAPLTSSVRALGLRSDFVVQHLPRSGFVTVRVPRGRPISMWSDADDWITSRLWWKGWLAVESATVLLWSELCRTARVAIDAGAHTGYFSLVAWSVGTQQVFAFEPHADIANRCAMNMALNQARVTVIPAALGDFTGSADLQVAGEGLPSGSSLVREVNAGSSRTVPVFTMDEWAVQWDVKDVDAMKLDVEGAELAVLNGAAGVLEASHPAVIFEVIEGCEDAAVLTAFFRERDYSLWRLTDDAIVPVDEVTLPGSGFFNYLAVHRGSHQENVTADTARRVRLDLPAH